eukprot:gene15551-21644_t
MGLPSRTVLLDEGGATFRKLVAESEGRALAELANACSAVAHLGWAPPADWTSTAAKATRNLQPHLNGPQAGGLLMFFGAEAARSMLTSPPPPASSPSQRKKTTASAIVARAAAPNAAPAPRDTARDRTGPSGPWGRIDSSSAPQEASRALSSLLGGQAFFETCETVLVRDGEQMTTLGLAAASEGMLQLGYKPRTKLWGSIAKVVLYRMDDSSPQELASVINSMAAAGAVPPSAWLDKLTTTITKNLNDWLEPGNEAYLAMLIRSMGGLCPELISYEWLERMMGRAVIPAVNEGRLSGGDFVACLWGAAMMNYKTDEIELEEIMGACCDLLVDIPTTSMSRFLTTLSVMAFGK